MSFCSAQSVLAHGCKTPFEIVIATEHDDYGKALEDYCTHGFILEKLTFTSDVQLQEKEFAYLVDLKIGTLIKVEDLKRVIAHLIKKNKFEKIVLYYTAYKDGIHMHIDLQGFWTFNKLKIHSIALGKDRYRQFYSLEAGDRFSHLKHTHSLDKIRQELVAEGYFNNRVSSDLEYDADTKSVTVHLNLHKGTHSNIRAIEVELKPYPQEMPDAETADLKSYILKQFVSRIANTSYSKAVLNKEAVRIKRYLAKQGFMQIDIELEEKVDRAAHKVDLVFKIELHHKRGFVFQGNSFFTDDDLFDRILLFGQSAWLVPASIIQQELEQLYKAHGFWDVVIDVQEKNNVYTFLIKEGMRARILDISLKGIEHAQAQEVRDTYFQDLLKEQHYDDMALNKALDELLSWYVGQGFLDAKIVKKEFIPLDVLHAYTLELVVYEGALAHLTSIEIPGFEELLQQGPFLAFAQSGSYQPFAMKDIDEQQRWLSDYFQTQGYFGVTIKPEFIRTQENIALCWHVNTGAQKNRFGKTVVQGSCDFPFEYVMRELQYKEGDLWDQSKLKLSMLKLRELEVFETINLLPYDLSAQEADKTIVLKLQKDDPFEVRLRSGFALQQVNKQLNNAGITYRAGGTFIAKNPFNWGDQFRVDGDIDLSQHSFVVQYRRSWLFDTPISTLLQGYANLIQQPGLIGFKKNLYQIQQQGIMLGLNKIYKGMSCGLNLALEFDRTSIREEDMGVSEKFALNVAQAINFEPTLLNKLIPYVLIEPTFLANYLDNKLQPTQGFQTLLTFKGMFPLGHKYSDMYFVRFLAEQSVFIPWWPCVFALRLRLGHMFHRNLRNIAPNERFYLGGANSIRSYETDKCPPLGVVVGDGPEFQLVPQGGKTMINANIEARFPLFKQMGGVVFQDLGILSGDKWDKLTAHNLLAGTGFGARYNTPLGPLRFDFAWKWHKRNPQDSSYAWFLTLGNAF